MRLIFCQFNTTNHRMYLMRAESCRVCGLEMYPDLRCEICKNFTNSHCPKCGKSSDEQIHIHKN